MPAMTRTELTMTLRACRRTKADLAAAFGVQIGAVYNWGANGRRVPPPAIALVEAWEELARVRLALSEARMALGEREPIAA
jgi:hypothetical protein